MRRTNPIAIALVLVLGALLVAGCGASDKQGYIKKFNKIQTDVAPQVNATGTDAKSLDKQIAGIDEAVTKLEKLDVPADYKKPHKDVVDSLKELKAQLTELKTTDDPAALAKLEQRAVASQKKYTAAINEMNKDRV